MLKPKNSFEKLYKTKRYPRIPTWLPQRVENGITYGGRWYAKPLFDCEITCIDNRWYYEQKYEHNGQGVVKELAKTLLLRIEHPNVKIRPTRALHLRHYTIDEYFYGERPTRCRSWKDTHRIKKQWQKNLT